MRHRIAIVGCGGMEDTHEEGFGALSDRVDVVATVDPILERAELARQKLGARLAVRDYREILDEVDAVLLVLPHHLHHSIGVDCLNAGKHVLLEKPLANSEQEVIDLAQAAERSGSVLMTAYPMRFQPLVVAMKRALDEGRLGEVFQVSIWTEQFTQKETGHWINAKSTLGGGQFFSHGCHYVDLLLWFLGDPVRGTHLGTRVGTPWLEGEGTSNVSIEFASGALGYHFGTWGARATTLGYTIHAHGTEGLLELDFEAGTLRHHRPDGEIELVAQAARRGDIKYVQGELAHFLDCIETGAQPETDAAGSLQGLNVIWRLYDAEEASVVADLRGLGLTR